MLPVRSARLAFAALAVAAALVGRSAAAAPTLLADSTSVDRWTLDNGLRVVVRNVPRARDVAITVGYRSGMDDDPAGQKGLAQLIGDLAFTSAAGDQPARTSADLDRDLPSGWSYPVMRHLTLLTEVYPRERARDGLARTATRMRGVRFDAAALAAAVKRTRRELGQQYFGDPTVALGFQVREIAAGQTDAQMLERAGGNGLAALTPDQVQAAMARTLVPANAVLSLAGDFKGVDLHAEVERLFGPIPGGTARPDAPEVRLSAGQRVVRRRGDPAAVVGIIAPALSDSTHPTFYMAVLLFAGVADQTWSGSGAPHRAVLQYALFDEPELARLFPVVQPRESDFTRIDRRLVDIAEIMRGAVIPSDSYDEMRASVSWLLGGPMPPSERAMVRSNRAPLMTLSRAQAGCELRRGPAFWRRYLRLLMDVRPGQPERAASWITDPRHQVKLLALPSGN